MIFILFYHGKCDLEWERENSMNDDISIFLWRFQVETCLEIKSWKNARHLIQTQILINEVNEKNVYENHVLLC